MHDHHDGKLDLVPMIDCIMLLLLFFILTTSFTSPDEVIAALLPPKGQDAETVRSSIPMTVRIVAMPDHLGSGHDAQEWQRRWRTRQDATGDTVVRIGGGEPFHLEGRWLGGSDPRSCRHREAFHAHLRAALLEREQPGRTREQQYPVEIHCFSALPWKAAMTIYDAVRAFEMERDPSLRDATPAELAHWRGIGFAPPAIRRSSEDSSGLELLGLTVAR